MSKIEATTQLVESSAGSAYSNKKDGSQFVMLQSALQMITAISRNDGKNLPEKIDSIRIIAETALKSAACVK